MTSAPILSTSGLSVGYRRRRRRQLILSGLDLHVSRGELVCLLGENGVGKSTLLRTLAGLQRPLAGRIELDGHDIAALRPLDRARSIGVVLSERISVGALQARQMVALGRYAYSNWAGRLSPADEAAIDRALVSVGAEALANRDCRELSDGERQRINLARVLAQEPSLILLDEPTAFLDVASRVELMGLLRRLARDSNIAAIASTHDVDLALRSADTVWMLSQDRKLHVGGPEDLLSEGAVAGAFAGKGLDLDLETLRFRPTRGAAPTARLIGPLLGRQLGALVLEREGFGQSDASSLVIEIADADGRWHLRHGETTLTGTNYAALAAYLRRMPRDFANAGPSIPRSQTSKG